MITWGIERAELIKNLEILGNTLCGYGGGPWRERRCDCKYIDDSAVVMAEFNIGPMLGKHRGESTGCAELRQVVEWLESPEGVAAARALAFRQAMEHLTAATQSMGVTADELTRGMQLWMEKWKEAEGKDG